MYKACCSLGSSSSFLPALDRTPQGLKLFGAGPTAWAGGLSWHPHAVLNTQQGTSHSGRTDTAKLNQVSEGNIFVSSSRG